jgi:16S rRNA (guanine527-N7)-methyltransferase
VLEVAEAGRIRALCGVSRETTDRLAEYVALLLKWNRRINLISRSTEDDVWSRHALDSAQLWMLRPMGARHWADLGSGAGFPGLVVAVLAQEAEPALRFTFVESDERKAAFLEAAARSLCVPVSVRCDRIERSAPLAADVLSARALAPFTTLLEYTEIHRQPSGMGLFPKGAAVHKELLEAARCWHFEHRLHRSLTEPAAAIVEVGALARV